MFLDLRTINDSVQNVASLQLTPLNLDAWKFHPKKDWPNILLAEHVKQHYFKCCCLW